MIAYLSKAPQPIYISSIVQAGKLALAAVPVAVRSIDLLTLASPTVAVAPPLVGQIVS